jgi:pyruvate/2-oxoglutarate dehydrogenase complex dihydrolipoamide acyltransferase (E2) component
MSVEVRIPQIGFSTQEGTLVEWLVPDGGTVQEGAPLYTLELDKSVQDVASPASGTLKVRGETGQVYPVGTLIAEIVQA